MNPNEESDINKYIEDHFEKIQWDFVDLLYEPDMIIQVYNVSAVIDGKLFFGDGSYDKFTNELLSVDSVERSD